MKKIFFSAVIAATALFTGCEDNFDAKIYGQLTTINFPHTEADYVSYMMDCYIPFSAYWSYNWGGVDQRPFYIPTDGPIRLLDVTTDLCAPWVDGWGGAFLHLAQCKFEEMKLYPRWPNDAQPNDYEKVRDITRMTKIIDDIEKAEVLSDAKKKEMVAECRLLRGLEMYFLFHFYGPVPVILDPAMVGNEEAEIGGYRPSLDEMTQYITDDLEFAAENMVETQTEKGRYNADYARFCLMRHYLNEGAHMQGYYQKAYEIFDKFTGNYALFTSGENPFIDQFRVANKNNSEWIMALSCSESGKGDAKTGNNFLFHYYFNNWSFNTVDDKGNPTHVANLDGGGWGQCYNIDPLFYDTFEENDKRKEGILTQFYHLWEGWVTRKDIGSKWYGFIVNKFPIETKAVRQANDFPLARWADALLLHAEADVRAHNSVSRKAIDEVNQVRHRAGLEDLPAESTSSVEAFLKALITERGHELYYEGTRKVDLIRFNTYYTTLEKAGRAPTSQYFPLPNYVIEQAQAEGKDMPQYFTRPDYDGPAN